MTTVSLLSLVLALAAAPPARAATYNFYFNNTEQGPNSNATPSLTVQDGKQVTPGQGEETAEEAAANPAAPPPSSPGPAPVLPPEEPGTTVSEVPAMERHFPDAKWKFSLARTMANYHSEDWIDSRNGELYQWMGSLTHYITPEIGLSFMAGRFLGPEIEINPFRTRTGWGKVQFGLTLAILKDTVGFDSDQDDDFGYASAVPASFSSSDKNWYSSMPVLTHRTPINVYGGAQIGFNVIRDLSLNFAYRIAPIERYGKTVSSTSWSANYLF